MAAQQPPEGEACAADWTVRRDGDNGILRACGQIAAPARAQRMQSRGEPAAIEVEQEEQETCHDAGIDET